MKDGATLETHGVVGKTQIEKRQGTSDTLFVPGKHLQVTMELPGLSKKKFFIDLEKTVILFSTTGRDSEKDIKCIESPFEMYLEN